MDDAQKYYDAAHSSAEAEDYAKAIQLYTQAIELNPKDDRIYFDRGKSRFFNQDFKGALEDFTKTLEINPFDFPAYVERGLTYTQFEQWEEAIENYEKALEICPEDYIAYYNRGEAYLHIKEYEKGINDLETAANIVLSDGDMLLYRKIRYRLYEVISSLGYEYEDTEYVPDENESGREWLMAVNMINFSFEPVIINQIQNASPSEQNDIEAEAYFQWQGKWYFVPRRE
ncbi:tetratricopeptide repeat protein [Nostoc sp. XA010]|jgi:tetratricopeptide (TPR) repeat protein|uniref:tetratricopeptide repeat protein n=1 Tax=Nostoc sp. XA010 TaxID=2780407 RepID=UPI001E4EDFD4|nr:tetratricopeptide repeat protein [Nostoc sp. XA010]MCC5661365.1 tetratricopeptide repeat protein [Nostoc sp. XA010]